MPGRCPNPFQPPLVHYSPHHRPSQRLRPQLDIGPALAWMARVNAHAPQPSPTMRRHARPALLASLLAAAACGTSPTAPGTGRSPADAAVTLTRLGDTAAVAGGAPVLASESRWLGELPVLDPEALAAGRIRAAAPGTATLRAGGAPLVVHVVPARPLVLAATVAPGDAADTLLLRGFRLRELGAVRVGGEPARVLGGDSATLRLAVA